LQFTKRYFTWSSSSVFSNIPSTLSTAGANTIRFLRLFSVGIFIYFGKPEKYAVEAEPREFFTFKQQLESGGLSHLFCEEEQLHTEAVEERKEQHS